nr:putative SCAN domain-containing protein SCAND2P [Vulpes vulpes]
MRARGGRCPGVRRAGAQGPGPESRSCSGSATGPECGGGIRAAGTRGDAPSRPRPRRRPGLQRLRHAQAVLGRGRAGRSLRDPGKGPRTRPPPGPGLRAPPCSSSGFRAPQSAPQGKASTGSGRAGGAAVHGSPQAAEDRASSQVSRVELFPFLNNQLGYSIR